MGVANDSDVVGGVSDDVCMGETCEACDVVGGGGREEDDDVEGAESGRGGAGAPATADKYVYIGCWGFMFARVATADSWEPSNVGRKLEDTVAVGAVLD